MKRINRSPPDSDIRLTATCLESNQKLGRMPITKKAFEKALSPHMVHLAILEQLERKLYSLEIRSLL